MIEKNRRYIETTIRIFESYNVDNRLIQDIADAYNTIVQKESYLIEPQLLNKQKGETNE